MTPRPWWLGAACTVLGSGVILLGLRPGGVGVMMAVFGLFVLAIDLHDRLRRPLESAPT